MYAFPTQLWNQLEDQFNLRADYSNRAMFGTRYIGLTGEVGDLLRFAATCRRAADDLDLPGDELLDELAEAVRCDHMGTVKIFYVPSIQHDTDQ